MSEPIQSFEESSRDADEYKALTSVLSAFYNYGQWARSMILNPKRLKWKSLTEEEKALIPWFPSHLEMLEFGIEKNELFFQDVALKTAVSWGAQMDPSTWSFCTTQDLDKVRGLMIQYVREWSQIGESERNISMGRILTACEDLYPDVPSRQDLQVLVPGAGLGRLVLEFVKRGFRTQGNEVSYHMLLNSSYILNCSYSTNNFCICPFIHKASNVAKRNYQIRQVYLPDYLPGDISLINEKYPEIPVGDLMSIVTGSFVDLYGPMNLNKINETYTQDAKAIEFRKTNAKKFNVVATCFFLDTASNVIDYIKSIRNCLRDDGYWVNFGPLLWHHEDDDEVVNTKIIDSITHEQTQIPTPSKGLELSREDLLRLIKDMGFEFVQHESDIETTYGGDDKALGLWKYKCEFWVCKKVMKA
ncbi:hypothetical protein FOA43_001020 [Brettanomyces nanus]|uniref:carnosine N-methyltransferase n=1 Tax=Eeniella nana TaxID=13502 RepID=A0A875RTP3_EENNA|nr:uncharacterized protein FOA43_001020 [Brettanomyces nanus]QPG73707.1 hypothetical protein FOA43_001020 [Brettanomyces nanus]